MSCIGISEFDLFESVAQRVTSHGHPELLELIGYPAISETDLLLRNPVLLDSIEMSELQREGIGAAAQEAIELHAAAEAGDPIAITRGALGNNAVRVHFQWGKLLMRDLLSRSPPS